MYWRPGASLSKDSALYYDRSNHSKHCHLSATFSKSKDMRNTNDHITDSIDLLAIDQSEATST